MCCKKQLQTASFLLQETIVKTNNTQLIYTNQFIDALIYNKPVLLEKVTLSWEYDKDAANIDEVWGSGISFTLYGSENDFVYSSSPQILNASPGAFSNPNPVFTISSENPELNLNIVCQGVSLFSQYVVYDIDTAKLTFDLAHIVNFHYSVLDQ